jgi:PKD repeat protein
MIKNITTDVTYGTLALAIAGLPATLNQNYTIEVTGETAGIAGFTYSGNCSTFKLTIQTPDTSVIDGAGATAITFGGTTKHNIEFIGFHIQNFVNGALYFNNTFADSDYLVSNCLITGTGNKAIRSVRATTNITLIGVTINVNASANILAQFNPAKNVIIRNCSFNNVAGYATDRAVDTFNIASILIEDSYFFGALTGAVYLKTISGASAINRCTFTGGTGSGVYIASSVAGAVSIKNSLFADQGSSALPAIYANGSVLDLSLENNTLSSNVSTVSTLVKCFTLNSFHACNNILANRHNTPSGLLWDIRFNTQGVPSSYQSDYNLFYRANTSVTYLFSIQAFSPNTYYSLAALQTAQSVEMNSIQGEPQFEFADPPYPDYMLQEGSPGHNAADPAHWQEFDLRNWYRELDNIDIGAYDRDADASGVPGDLSTDATLSAIWLDDVLVPDFDPAVLTYDVVLPHGTTSVPVITYQNNHPRSNTVMGDATPPFPNQATLVVTAEDDVTILTYTINFTVLPSDDASLSDLLIDGVTIPGFVSSQHSYSVGLPPETVIIPTVTCVPTDPDVESAIVTDAETLPGSASIIVMAEDGITSITYTVTFIFATPSLLSISYNDIAISEFAPHQLSYDIILPYGTSSNPMITAVAGVDTTIQITNVLDIPGGAVVVASAAGIDAIYVINFTICSTPPPSGIYIESKYLAGDSTTYAGIMSAVLACTPLVRNETIVLNTLDEVISAWMAQSNDTEFKLTIKAGPVCDAANVRAIIADNGRQGVAFSIEQFSNLELINLDMDGSGTLGGCKIGPTKAYNIVFRNCVLGGGDHGFYLYAGEGIEFYDCLAHNFAQYGFHILSFKDVILDNCDVEFGTLPVNKTWRSDAAPIYISGGTNIVLRNCRMVDQSRRVNNICKVTNTDNLLFESCSFSGAFQYTLWFTGSNTPFACNNIEVRNCFFEHNQLAAGTETKYGAFLIELTNNTKFIHNTFAETQMQTYFWDCWGVVKVEIVNNYFYLKRTTTSNMVVVRVRGTSAGTPEGIVIKNNYYDLVAISTAWTVLSISGSGYLTKTYANVAAAQVAGLEVGSGNDFGSLLTPKVDLDFIPLAGGPLVGAAAADHATKYDARFFVKDAVPNDIGAFESGATAFEESQHTLDFAFTNLGDGLPYDTTAAQVDIPAFDPVHISLNVDYNRYFNNIIIKSRLSPIAIKRTSGHVIVLSGSHLLDMNTPFAFKIAGSVANNGYYTRPYILSITYNEADTETLIFVSEELQDSTNDGTLFWENNQVSIFGVGGKFSFSQRYAHYDLMLVSRKPGFEDRIIYKKNYINVIQQRPSPNFRLSAYMIFPGDAVSFTNKSVGCDAIMWEIDDPSGTGLITSTENQISNVVYNIPGSYTVRLTGTNSTPFVRTLTRTGVIKVMTPPSRPFIQFNTSKEVLWHTDSVQLRSTLDPDLTHNITRFSQIGDVITWRITNSNTGALVYISNSLNPIINWGTEVGGALGAFDVEMRVYNPTWGGVQMSKRRLLTVYKSPAGRTTHSISCSRDDLWQNPDNNAWYTRSVIDGLVPSYGNKSAQHGVITAGDVVKLSGYSPELRMRNLKGTAENPILIIPDTTEGPFQIGGRKYEGFRFEGCEFCQLVGTPNEADLQYGFEFFTDPDPAIYAAAPGNKLINVASFSTNVEICGCDCHDSKFDGMSAKTDPDLNDPNTWRNGYCTQAPGGFILKDLNIHHNIFHETMGEGIYIGYFEHTKITTITHPLTGLTVDVYPHVHQDMKVYRNEFINNGFDGIQVGNYIGGVEIHDNTILGAGWQRTFGQCSAFSVNYMVGDIYNNTFEGGIVGGVPDGRLRIFNNTLGFSFDNFGNPDPIYLDGIYLIQSPMPKWDYSTVPPTIIDPTYDYQNSSVFLYHNTIRTPRTPFTLFGYYNPPPKEWVMANNVAIYTAKIPPQLTKTDPEQLYLSAYIQIGSEVGTPIRESIGNIWLSESEIDSMLFESPDEFKWKVSMSSPLLSGGVDLKVKWPTFSFADSNGFTFPTPDNVWYRGAFSFNPINYEYSAATTGNILYRIWSITKKKWLFGSVELEIQINPMVAPDASADEVDANSVVLLVR